MDSPQVFDKEGALDRVDQDKELLFELLDLFYEDLESQMTELRAAVQADQSELLEERAHSLKSAVGNLGAARCFQCLSELEKLGRESGPNERAKESLAALEKELQAFKSEIESFRASPSS